MKSVELDKACFRGRKQWKKKKKKYLTQIKGTAYSKVGCNAAWQTKMWTKRTNVQKWAKVAATVRGKKPPA